MKQGIINENPDVAVVIPCFNEARSIGKVVDDFKTHLPSAKIYVFDNNSKDRTAEIATEHGAIVIQSPDQGKGHVVQHMAKAIDADIFVMVDGDDTYHAPSAPMLVKEFIDTGASMLVATRLATFESNAFRAFHEFGNQIITRTISILFATEVTDVLSGYRVMSREFMKTVPLRSKGFEIETEMTLQALAKGFSIREIAVPYGARSEGSFSKLNTYSDGVRIIRTIFLIFKDYKPLVFFTSASALLAILSVAAGFPAIQDYFVAGYVYHVPRAVLAAAIGILSMLSLCVGLILDTILKYHNENFQLWRRQLGRR